MFLKLIIIIKENNVIININIDNEFIKNNRYIQISLLNIIKNKVIKE